MHGSFSCQLIAVRPLSSLGADISETAQPYQTGGNRYISPCTESGSPARMLCYFQAKKYRTCLAHMPSQWVRGVKEPTIDGKRHQLLYSWRENDYPI